MNLLFVAFLFGVASATDTTKHSDSEISAESTKKQLRGRALGGGNGGGNSGLANHEVAPCLHNLPVHSSSTMASCKPKQSTAAPIMGIDESDEIASVVSNFQFDRVLVADEKYFQESGKRKIQTGSTSGTIKMSYKNFVKHAMFAQRSCGGMINGVMKKKEHGSGLTRSATEANFKDFLGFELSVEKTMVETSKAIHESSEPIAYIGGFEIEATSFEACARNAMFSSDIIQGIRTNCPVVGGVETEVEISAHTLKEVTAKVVQRQIVTELEQRPNTKVSYNDIMHMAAGCASTGSTLYHNVYVKTPGCGPFN